MKAVFALLLAVAWVATASASDCKNKWSVANCKLNRDMMKQKYHKDMCVWAPAKGVADNCKKFCKACGPWNACNPVKAGKDNVMCIYKKGVFGPRCTAHGPKSSVKTGPISKKLQKYIVDKMNKLRQKVASGKQPGLPAGTIPDLKWDDGLAAASQRWADQCPDGKHPHSKNNAIKQFPAGAGQNFAATGTSAKKVPKTLSHKQIDKDIDMWYNEVKDFVKHKCPINKVNFNCAGGAMIGHFTALIWAKTTSVGCGYIKNKSVSGGHEYYMTTLICDFGPEGNIIGHPIYIKK